MTSPEKNIEMEKNFEIERAKNALNFNIPLLKKYHLDRWVITGGFATLAYGVDRPLTDIDIDIDTSIHSPDFKAFLADPELQAHLTQPLEHNVSQAYDNYGLELTVDNVVIDICPMEEMCFVDKETGAPIHGYANGFPEHEFVDFHGITLPLLAKRGVIAQKKQTDRDEYDRRDVRELENLLENI